MNKQKKVYIIYTGLDDESIQAYIGEIRNILRSLGYEVIDPANFLLKRLYLSTSETNDESLMIEEYIKETDFVIEVVRGSDIYEQRLKEPQTEFAMGCRRSYKKPVIVLFPYYRCHKQEFDQLAAKKRDFFLRSIPSKKSIFIRSIEELPDAVSSIEEKYLLGENF